MTLINQILKQWGLHINSVEKRMRNSKSHNFTSFYSYNLNYYNNINSFLNK